MSVNYGINEHARELLVYSRASDHSARLVIVKARVVRLVHCSPRLELSLLGSARQPYLTTRWSYLAITKVKEEIRQCFEVFLTFFAFCTLIFETKIEMLLQDARCFMCIVVRMTSDSIAMFADTVSSPFLGINSFQKFSLQIGCFLVSKANLNFVGSFYYQIYSIIDLLPSIAFCKSPPFL